MKKFKKTLSFLLFLFIIPILGNQRNNSKSGYIMSPFAGTWLELGAGFDSNKLKLIFKNHPTNQVIDTQVIDTQVIDKSNLANKTEPIIENAKINQEISIQNNIKEYFKSTNGLLLGRAIFANVSENNIYNALILGVSINPKLNEKFEFAKWQEKYNTQFGVEFGLAGQNILLFSNILVTKAENLLAGSFGVGIAIVFDKIQFRLQIAAIKSKSKQILEEKAKNSKLSTLFTIAFKN
jgi:hypothetical protein